MGTPRSNAWMVIIALMSVWRISFAAPIDASSSEDFSPTTEAAIITSGLVASYPFNGNANDDSGNGHNGTVFGATLTADRYGDANSAYDFDGGSDYIRIPDAPGLNFTADFSVCAWIRTTTVGSMVFSNMLETSPHSGYSFRLENSGRMYAISGDVLLIGNSPVTTDTWRHVAFTLTGTTGRIYIDGGIDVTGTVGVPTVFSNDQTIGSSYIPNYFFDGAIDDVHLYNRALTSGEISQLAVPEPTGLSFLAIAAGIIATHRRRLRGSGVKSGSGNVAFA